MLRLKKYGSYFNYLNVKYWKRRQETKLLKGFRRLKFTKKYINLSEINLILTESILKDSLNKFSKFQLGGQYEEPELILRQYLLLRLGGYSLNKALLIAAGKRKYLTYPLPKTWRIVIEQKGFQVAHFRSGIMFYIYVVILWAFGVFCILKSISLSSFKNAKNYDAPYDYIHGLSKNNINQKNGLYDFLAWYINFTEAEKEKIIIHSIKKTNDFKFSGRTVKFQNNPLRSLVGVKSTMLFICWSILVTIISFLDLIRGRWWHAFLLNQSALASQAKLISLNNLAKTYYFSQSSWLYKPMWTYAVEKRGSKVILYFYSTNCEGFSTTTELPRLSFGYRSMTWREYFVWDDYQYNFVERATEGRYKLIKIVGPIWFSDYPAQIQASGSKRLAVFDVTPVKESRYILLGMDFEIYTSKFATKFLFDINYASKEVGANILLKRKRKITDISDLPYINYVEQLESYITVVDERVSANRVIDESDAVISMPYTSTGILAKIKGKPSAFYDPTGLLHKNDSGAHGVKILSNTNELREWLGSQFS